MQSFISIDFESRSTVDLRKSGVYPYAAHKDTDLWCMAYALTDKDGDGKVQLWLPGDPVPSEIQYALDKGYEFRAWNAAFERIMYFCIATQRYGFPKIPHDRWVCTAAEAAALALPRGLGRCASILFGNASWLQKDDKGHRLMLQMSKPRKRRKDEKETGEILWWDSPQRLARLCDYCQQDVVVERALAKRLRRLDDTERSYYLLDQHINDKGVLIDVKLVQALQRLVDECLSRARVTLQELTGGEVESVTNVQNMRTWLNKQGLDLKDLTKRTVTETLERDDLESKVMDVLQLRADAGKTSVAKLGAMLACLCTDNRARGLLLYHGAGTGRWSGKLIQPQNFPRPTVDSPEQYIPQVMANDYDGLEKEHPVLEIVTSLLRSCFVATTGSSYMCADFSAIEGHVTAWLAGQDHMMDYKEMAGIIYSMDPADVGEDSKERHVGKTAVLGCGFGMGPTKYKDTVKAWTGVEIEDDIAERAVAAYRVKNHKIKALWYDLEDAAVRAVRHPGEVFRAGRQGCIRYVVRGQFLWCMLPSGRPLAYAKPSLEPYIWGKTDGVISKHHTAHMPRGFEPDGVSSPAVEVSTTDSFTGKWGRRSLYGGLQTENVAQAIARDIMAASMKRVQDAGYPVILTVHDEVLAEVPNNHGSLDDFNTLMAQRPAWGAHIPVAVKGWEEQRYRK